MLAALFAAGSCLMSGILSPRRSTVEKLAPYECGIIPGSDTPERFPVRFFLIAMAFIVFDVEIILFYPYAVARGGLGFFGLVVVLIFTFAVFESFLYLIGAGALNWGPSHSTQQNMLKQSSAMLKQASEKDQVAVSDQFTASSAPSPSVAISNLTTNLKTKKNLATTNQNVRCVGLEGRTTNLEDIPKQTVE